MADMLSTHTLLQLNDSTIWRLMKAKFEKTFLKGVKKHAGIKKQIEQKVHQIMEHPVELGEPL